MVGLGISLGHIITIIIIIIIIIVVGVGCDQ
jgi:hypothetical protein